MAELSHAPPNTVARTLIRTLARHSTHIFGVSGANIEDLLAAIAADAEHGCCTLTPVISAHEHGAVTMADGYARSTTRLGLVMATSGGGALNLVAGLGEAFDSRVPVLALIGQPPMGGEGRGAFQDTSGKSGTIDAHTLFSSVTDFCAKVTSPEELPQLLAQALAATDAGGPAALLLPKDVQTASLDVGDVPLPDDSAAHPFNASPLDDVVELLEQTRGKGDVLILAGAEVARHDAREQLREFAHAAGALVVTDADAKDSIGSTDPAYAGVAGIMGRPDLVALVDRAQVVILAGSPVPMLSRAGLETAVTHGPLVVHLGEREPFVPVDFRCAGRLPAILTDLTRALKAKSRPMSPAKIRSLRTPWSSGPGVRYSDAVHCLNAHLRPGDDVFADAGNTGAAVIHHLRVPDDGRFTVALGMGGMGYAFGGGIGSALGRTYSPPSPSAPDDCECHATQSDPDAARRTYVVAGDGAFFMHGAEIHTAVEYDVPVTFVVFNNNAHAMCVTREQVFFAGAHSHNRFRPAHIGDGVSAMYPGLPVWNAATLAEFNQALAEAATVAGPAFICLVCDPDEIPPFAPFLQEHSA